jgi:hypothetical protein
MMFVIFIPFAFLLLALAPRMIDQFRRSIEGTATDVEKRSQVGPQGRIFQLAAKLGGKLTVSDVVIETGLDVAEAERVLDDMVDGHRVQILVSEQGFTQYEFREISGRSEARPDE